jgi:hypothetical protein
MVVVLPAPLGPSSPKISPRATANESPSTAVTSPKRRVSPRASMAGPFAAARAGSLRG